MTLRTTQEIMHAACSTATVVPAFNIPYLPMMAPVVEALRDAGAFGLIAVARLEWEKFESGSPRAIYEEYQRVKDERYTRLHMDHVPVIDEDNLRVDYEAILTQAAQLGYESVMVDGSRLPLDQNIAATRRVADMAHAAGVALEAELGAVLGHEAGPMPPYEEIFASGRGFTDPDEARRFVEESGADWLSVAIGSVHGAISAAKKREKKIAARLNIEQLDKIRQAANVPLVLHGGSGIPKKYILDAIKHGIAKVNIATAIRQPYEVLRDESIEEAKRAAYEAVRQILRDELDAEGSAQDINPT
ncbi:MAG: class II fructose-bisphosphate aldolase [Planctomycetes bacterium]|nr:class II fructose-bisphosphate aldolase [Planctomycetota bacterium]